MVATYRTELSGTRDGQARTYEGGVAFAVDQWTRLRRFLVLGVDRGPYFVGEPTPDQAQAQIVADCLSLDPTRTLKEIVAVSAAGWAVHQTPSLYALALAASHANPFARQLALAELPCVCRTSTHLFLFAAHVAAMRGWGRGLRRAIGAWYNTQPIAELTGQTLRLPRRAGWSHADLLRLAHPKTAEPSRNALYKWIVEGILLPELAETAPTAHAQLTAYIEVVSTEFHLSNLRGVPDPAVVARCADLIRTAKLPREAIPATLLKHPAIWDALLDEMTLPAILRNLAAMAQRGVLTPGSAAARTIRARLTDADRVRRSRLHPLAFLAALRHYTQGEDKGSQTTWQPVAAICDALDSAFYSAIGNVTPTGKRIRLILDLSRSRTRARIAGLPSLSMHEVAASLALLTAAIEPDHEIILGSDVLTIPSGQRLEDLLKTLHAVGDTGNRKTRPALKTMYTHTAIDAFITFESSSENAARAITIHPTAASAPTADDDPLHLIILGFDPTTPRLINEFASGTF